jgi:hypothetical protein
MRPFEDELRDVLKPVEPPAGFTQRVLARVEARHRRRHLWWLAAAALLVVTLGVGYQRDLERRRGLEAKEKLMRSMEITGEHLRNIQKNILNEVTL